MLAYIRHNSLYQLLTNSALWYKYVETGRNGIEKADFMTNGPEVTLPAVPMIQCVSVRGVPYPKEYVH